jgi:hypothetical protein
VRDREDDVIDHIVSELKTLPGVPADATARVLARVDAARRAGLNTDVDDDVIYFPTVTDEMRAATPTAQPARALASAGGFRRRFMVSLPAAVGYALAATLAGFLIRGAMPRAGADATRASAAVVDSAREAAATPVTSVALTREAQEAPQQVQFVLDAREAKSVAVVGDFNDWDGSAHPLVRDSRTGTWSTVVPVTPGRHVYAYLVDGSVWTLDPYAPKTKDADYGTEQSVMIVGVR